MRQTTSYFSYSIPPVYLDLYYTPPIRWKTFLQNPARNRKMNSNHKTDSLLHIIDNNTLYILSLYYAGLQKKKKM